MLIIYLNILPVYLSCIFKGFKGCVLCIHKPIQLESSISRGEFSCKANSRENITYCYDLLFECFLLRIICSVNKCKVKSVKYNLKYKNKAVRICHIPGIKYKWKIFFFIFIILYSLLIPSYV